MLKPLPVPVPVPVGYRLFRHVGRFVQKYKSFRHSFYFFMIDESIQSNETSLRDYHFPKIEYPRVKHKAANLGKVFLFTTNDLNDNFTVEAMNGLHLLYNSCQ